MKLVHGEYDISLDINENMVSVLVVEDRRMMQELVMELYRQYEGHEGSFVLSSEGKIHDISKKIELIIDPFSIDINNKKLLTKLYQDMDRLSKENICREQIEFNAYVAGYLQRICDLTPYQLNFTQEFAALDIIKFANVKIEVGEMTMLESLVNYIGLMGEIGQREVFVFVNLKSYLQDKDMENLYEYVHYHKLQLLLIENLERTRLETEDITIIDVDKCIF